MKKEFAQEKKYYLSLGYTEREADLICALTFERPYRNDLFRNMALSKSALRVKKAAPMDGMMGGAPAPAAGQIMYDACAAPAMSSPAVSAQANFTTMAKLTMAETPEMVEECEWGAPNIEDVRWDSYDSFEDSRIKDVANSPLSTFRTTNNTAAATVLLGNYERYTRTVHDMVRTEELLNFLEYELNAPDKEKGGLFELTAELKREGDKGFLFLGLAGKKTLPAKQNIVLLIDTSGSMSSKTLQIRVALATVFARLNDGDKLSIVTYSDVDHVFINGMTRNKKHDIEYVIKQLDKMYISGCTNGSRGIETAYDIAVENFAEGGLNRVIMVTDGDLNFGVTQNGQLKDLIENKKKSGVYYSAIGCGLYNLQDDKLETLAKNGNGNYYVINSIKDAENVLRDRYEALVYPIAKNVKAQVEFNPAAVKGYRLLGFENRALAAEDFRDDTVESEPFGSGDKCVACYELYFGDTGRETKPLKYGGAGENVDNASELCTLSVRCELLDGGHAEQEFAVSAEPHFTGNLEKAFKAAELAETLRNEKDSGLVRRALRQYAELAGYLSEDEAD